MVGHIAFVQNIFVNVEINIFTLRHKSFHGDPERIRGTGDDRHVGGGNQLCFGGVKVTYINHDNPIGRQGFVDPRIDTPLGQGQAGTDGHRHATQHP